MNLYHFLLVINLTDIFIFQELEYFLGYYMVDLVLYQEIFDLGSSEELLKTFQKSVVVTNRDASFFVNWQKVIEHTAKLKIELSLMNSLIGSTDIESDFRSLIKKYPETLRCVPILIAMRPLKFPVIANFFASEQSMNYLNFNKRRGSKLTINEVEEYLTFMKNSGLFIIFESIKNLYDYVLGVEVGMDTNARKNRSGQAMENLISPVLRQISTELGCKLLIQPRFGELSRHSNVPDDLADRTADYILFKNNKFVNIEVNYFTGGGSKVEEIIPSYINRKNILEQYGWSFIWITDGNAWTKSIKQLTIAFKDFDYIFNIDFINKGLLKKALEKVLQ
jgi:type II restriction enzyme